MLHRYSAYLPLSGSDSYDNTASVYNVSIIVDAHGNFNAEAYENYSSIYMPTTFALGYGISFAVMTCLPVHVYLYHWTDIKNAFIGKAEKDIHARLIMRYKDVAWWWYAGMTVCFLFREENAQQSTNSTSGVHSCHGYHDTICLEYWHAILGCLTCICNGCSICCSCWHCLCRRQFE